MPAPRFGETDEEVQNEAQKSILRVFHALILSDFFGASALYQEEKETKEPLKDSSLGYLRGADYYRRRGDIHAE